MGGTVKFKCLTFLNKYMNLGERFRKITEGLKRATHLRESGQAAQEARVAAKKEQAATKPDTTEMARRAALAERVQTDLKLEAVRQGIAKSGGVETEFTPDEIAEAVDDLKEMEGPEAETGQALEEAINRFKKSQAGGKN